MHLSRISLFILASGLSGVLAQPAGRSHRHSHKHKKDISNVNWDDESNYTGVNWATVNYGGSTASSTSTASSASSTSAGSAASVSSPVAQVHAAQISSSTSSSSSSSTQSSSSAAATSSAAANVNALNTGTNSVNNGNVDQYQGNTGTAGYGSNMQQVSSIGNNNATNTIKNTSNAAMTIIMWLKVGKDGKANSGQSQPSTEDLSFTLAPGESKIVAYGPNTQVGWSRDCSRRADDNAPDCTWGEADFGNESNNGWSGYDVSSIQNSKGNNEIMIIDGVSSDGSCKGQTSSNTVNNWTSFSQANQGAGGNINTAPGQCSGMHLTTQMGGVTS